MPELPEVQAFKAYMQHHCIHKKITDVASTHKKIIKEPSFTTFKKNILDHNFKNIEHIGKYLVITLNSNSYLIIHFGLTGNLQYSSEYNLKVPFSKLTFMFIDKTKLDFISKRLFTKVWLINDLNKFKPFLEIGPDALHITQKKFINLLETYPQKNIKSFLMDQKIISGIGNEYSDEILFQAGISPKHKIDFLDTEKQIILYKKMISVLSYATKLRTKTILHEKSTSTFLSTDKKQFKKSFLQAHRHFDNTCPKHSQHSLKKITVAGRTSYYCPIDQK